MSSSEKDNNTTTDLDTTICSLEDKDKRVIICDDDTQLFTVEIVKSCNTPYLRYRFKNGDWIIKML